MLCYADADAGGLSGSRSCASAQPLQPPPRIYLRHDNAGHQQLGPGSLVIRQRSGAIRRRRAKRPQMRFSLLDRACDTGSSAGKRTGAATSETGRDASANDGQIPVGIPRWQ
jgi:hypothetical protein